MPVEIVASCRDDALDRALERGAIMLGEVDEGFKYAQVRLAPARLTHCMRWLGACTRAHEVATAYAVKRQAFGKALIDHEGVGFMLADNLIDLKQAELMIDWCAGVLDSGAAGIAESSMAKVAVSEALFRIADRCVQVMGGTGVTRDTIVEQVFHKLTDDLDTRVADRLMMMLPGGAIKPAEIGETIVWLASPAARMITGAVIAHDGGMS